MIIILGLLAVNAKYIHSNLPLRYLRQRFKEPSQFYFFEYTINHHIDDAFAQLVQSDLDHLFVSLYIWNCEWVHKLLTDLKSVKPHLKIFVGGPEAECHGAIQQVYPWADVLIKGDLDAIMSLDDLTKVLNTVETTVDLGRGQLPLLPFAYTEQELSEMSMVYYESDRGCPFRCTFCMASRQNKLEYKPLNSVFEDLQQFMDAGVSQVKFVDRTFNRDPERALAIIQFILEHHNGLTNFHFELAPHLIQLDIIDVIAMAPEGVFQFEIGIQSYHIKTLEAIKRNPNQVLQLEGLKKLIQVGKAHIHVDLIAGLPYETLASFEVGFNALMALEPHMIQLGFLKLLKGTDLFEERQKYAYKIRQYAPYEVIASQTIDAMGMIRLKGVESCVETYYNTHRFKHALRYLRSKVQNAFYLFDTLAQLSATQQEKGARSTVSDYELLLTFGERFKGVNNKVLENLLRLDYVTHFSGETRFYKPQSMKLNNHIHELLSDQRCQMDLMGEVLSAPLPVKELLKKGQLVVFDMDLDHYFNTGECIDGKKEYFVIKKKNAKHTLPRYAYIEAKQMTAVNGG